MKEDDDELMVLERPAGSTCQHASKVLHGVTNLTGASRKSLRSSSQVRSNGAYFLY
jgi:hypothetical protein